MPEIAVFELFYPWNSWLQEMQAISKRVQNKELETMLENSKSFQEIAAKKVTE